MLHGFSEIEFGKDAALCSECDFRDDDVASETNCERARFKAILIASEIRLRDSSAACARRFLLTCRVDKLLSPKNMRASNS
jgi:hypothetical protein